MEERVTEDVGIIFEYLHLCICVFVYLCICVFVYLCICVFVFEKSGEGRVPVSHRGRRVQRVFESRRNCGSFPNHTTAPALTRSISDKGGEGALAIAK